MNYSSCHTLLNVAMVLSLVLTLLISIPARAEPPSNSPAVIAPYCSEKCGSVSIPYPFGIEGGCYFEEQNNVINSSFQIHCDNTSSPPTPILGRNFKVQKISVTEAEILLDVYVSFICYDKGGYVGSYRNSFRLVTFTLSSTKNILVATGCDTYAWFFGFRNGMNYSTGCMTKCVQESDIIDGECSGIGCCQASIPRGVHNATVKAYSFSNHSLVYGFNPCSIAFPIAKDAFKFNPKYLGLKFADLNQSDVKTVPVVFNWAIGKKTCSAAKAERSCLCQGNAECFDQPYESGYRCKCKHGFSGNPYLSHGCTDIDECKEVNDCEKSEFCINTNGGYYCKCPKGHHGGGTMTDRCVPSTKPWLVQSSYQFSPLQVLVAVS